MFLLGVSNVFYVLHSINYERISRTDSEVIPVYFEGSQME